MVKRRNFHGVFKKFIDESSIRGAPKIIRSSSIAWRVIWFFVVIIFLLLTIYTLANLFITYYEYQKESNTYEVLTDRAEAPSVTVCNLNPLADHTYDEFVLGCEMLLVDGKTKDKIKVECDDAAKIKNVNCYTIEFNNTNHPESYPVGYSFLFYVDANGNSLNDEFNKDDDNSKSGVKLALHPSDILPDIQREGINLPPGYATSVEAKVRKSKLLPAPYGQCEESEFPLFDLNGNRIAYTPAMCEQACAQKIITDKCKCLMPEVMAVRSSVEANQPYCEAVRPECLASEKGNISTECRRCPVSCEETTYAATTTSARWPPISQHLSFYKTNIKGKSYASNFEIYDKIESELKAGNVVDATDQLMQNNHIYENFLKVNIHVDGTRVQVTEETVKHDFASLGPQFGGLMSLFCGVTLVFFIEIIHLFCSLIAMAICGEDMSVASEPDDNDDNITRRQNSVENKKEAANGDAADVPQVKVDSSEAADGQIEEATVKVED